MNEESPPAQPAEHDSVSERLQQLIHQAEDYSRREPAKAAAAAFGAGLLLNVLPTRFIVGTLTAIAVPFVRPALLTLGLVKACELACGGTGSPRGEGDED